MESSKEKWSKYHRKQPIKEFDINQTMYDLIKDENKDNLDLEAIGFLGFKKTYKTLFEEVDKLADAYVKAGVKAGDTVALFTISMPLVQQNLLALSKIGATSKWIDVRVKEKDLINRINKSNCRIAVVFDEFAPLFEKIIDETDIEKVLVCSPKEYLNPVIHVLANLKDKKEGKYVEPSKDKRFSKFNDFVKSGDKSSIITPVKFEKDRPSIIVGSSGSTGKTKDIIHTEYNFNAEAQKLGYTDLPLYRGKTLYVAVPPFIIYGLANSIYSSLAFSMKAEMTPFVTDFTVYDDLGKFDIPFGAPLHYRYIYEKLEKLTKSVTEFEKENTPSSKRELKKVLKELNKVLSGIEKSSVFVSGGDKISSDEILTMQQRFNKIIVNGYGNNEVVGAAIVSPIYANKPGSIGIPMKGIDAKIIDSETKEELKQGQEGELILNTDNAFIEYMDNPEETKKIKQKHSDEKEWIHTGDLCYIDEDGYIIPKGRSKRLIRKDCFKISPDTIENVITSLPFVKECVVVGVPDPKFLSVPMAYIEFEDEYKNKMNEFLPKIKEVCEEDLPDYEIPSYFDEIEIPYQNNKQNFKKLEELGSIYVENLNSPKLTYKK